MLDCKSELAHKVRRTRIRMPALLSEGAPVLMAYHPGVSNS